MKSNFHRPIFACLTSIFLALSLVLLPTGTSAISITGSFDPTGAPLLTRLLAGSGIALGDISNLEYIGNTIGFAQAGLFDPLTLRGDKGTSLTLGSGIVLSSGSVSNLPTTNTQGSYSNVTNTGGNMTLFAISPRKRSPATADGSMPTFEEKLVLANSPSLSPSPVKSKRSTAIPWAVSACAIRVAAKTLRVQVKQCANRAKARAVPSGRSRRAASRLVLSAPTKVIFPRASRSFPLPPCE